MSVARSRSTAVPADSLAESPMEFVGEPRASGACNLLGVPGLSCLDVDDEEGEMVIGIRPKSSPLPRRRSSVSDEDSEPEPPPCGSRRVSFADTKGLRLVRVKEFDTWDLPKLPYDSLEGERKEAEEYCLSPLFSFLLSSEELLIKVQEQKVELEAIELLPGTTIVKGLIRVLNISFNKAVYVRTSLDAWSSHFDLLAEYIPSASDGVTDCFSFKLTLVPPFGEQGARVDFCLRYETPVGTFWANNDNSNYVLFCHQRVKEPKEKSQRENVSRKSCLKAVSQDFPIVENVSSLETLPSLENVSTGASKHGEKVASIKAQQISDSQSGTSGEDGQKVLNESSRNCSRRSRRRTARLARVKDYFAQRDGKPNQKESEVSLQETSQAAQGENPLEMHSNVSETPSISEERSKSGGVQFVSEPLATSNKTSPDVQYETYIQDSTSNNKPDKSESICLADTVTLKTGGKDATDIPNDPLHPNDEPAPTKHQNINKPVSKAEDNRQRQMESSKEGMNDESTSNTAAESDGNVISAESVEGLVSLANSFTFGTVVAPLYHQVFGKVGSEGQNIVDCGNPMRGRLNMGDSSTIQNYPHTERRETSSSVSADACENHAEILGDTTKTQESDQECIDTALNHPLAGGRETSWIVSADASWSQAEILQDLAEIQESDQRCTDTPEDPKLFSEEEVLHPRTLNVFSTDVSNTRIPGESVHLQGKSQEDNLTHDLECNYLVQKETTAEMAQAQSPEDACSQIKMLPDATLSQAQTQADTTSIQPSFLLPQLSQIVSVLVNAEMDQQISSGGATECVDGSNKDDDTGTTDASPTNAYSEQDKPSEALQDLDPNSLNDSTTTEANNSSIGDDNIPESNVEIVEEKLVKKDLSSTTHETSLETVEEPNNVEESNEVTDNSHKDETKLSAAENEDGGGEVAESVTKATTSSYHIHSDMFVEFKDEDTLKEKPIIVSEKEEHCEIKDIVTKQEDASPGVTTEDKNWEMMVEEEEENVLRDQEGSEAINIKDLEAVEKEEGEVMEEQLEDTGIEKVEVEFEGMEEEEKMIEEEMEEEIAAAEEEEEEGEGIDDKEMIEEEEMEEAVAGEEKELEEDVEAMQKEKIVEEQIAQEIVVGEEEEEVETELEEEEEVIAMQEVDIQGAEVQEEEMERERGEEMEIDMNEEDETGVEWEDEVEPQEENMQREISDDEEEMLVDEAAEEEIVFAEAEGTGEGTAIEEREDEAGGLEERSDVTQNKVEDDLSAPVNNVHEGVGERVIDKENTGEGENVRGPTEIYSEEVDQSNNGAPHDQAKAAKDESDSTAAEGGSCILTDEPESDQTSDGNASTESLSDDEVELYMHCLRAVHGQRSLAQASRDRNKDTGFSVSRRPSGGRGKQLPSPMPSISESVDEEQHPGSLQDSQEDVETEDFQPTAAPRPAASGQESINRKVAWWKETFSWSNISKTLLYTTLLVVFLVVAYHYDFLACFGLYLISVFWLCCQGEKQPVKNNNRIG